MKRKIFSVIALLIGLTALAYPHISSYLNDKNGSYVSQDYHAQAKALDPALVKKMWRQAEIYNENLTGSPVHDPFIPGSGVVMPENYYDVLNYKGQMATIEIPKIKVELPIYHGTGEKVLQKAVGHLEGSTLPIGGKSRHAVMTGHTGLSHTKIFTNLTELVKGDQFYLKVLGKTLAYEVDQILVVKPSETDHLKVEKGRDLVTLLTCTPYGINTHRLLVRGHRIPYSPAKKANIKPVNTMTAEQKRLIIVAIITTFLMVLLNIVLRIRNKRQAV
ncbi:class C sortase [Enterococcus sp. CSURQ0835]|uniref:class C sortase n=1 Tax=Enterococcus sp. CSURQ0835 TaxID=2681394 RepID=UPI0013599872|nr:class C sortase [Enterococcus sp. CSURQ0835]